MSELLPTADERPRDLFLERAKLAEAKVQELEAENVKLRAVVADADILFGTSWQESMKSVGGLPHESSYAQMTKLAGDVAVLQEEKAELEAENARLRAALKPLAEATHWQMDDNCKIVDVWEVDESEVNRAKEVLSS